MKVPSYNCNLNTPAIRPLCQTRDVTKRLLRVAEDSQHVRAMKHMLQNAVKSPSTLTPDCRQSSSLDQPRLAAETLHNDDTNKINVQYYSLHDQQLKTSQTENKS